MSDSVSLPFMCDALPFVCDATPPSSFGNSNVLSEKMSLTRPCSNDNNIPKAHVEVKTPQKGQAIGIMKDSPLQFQKYSEYARNIIEEAYKNKCSKLLNAKFVPYNPLKPHYPYNNTMLREQTSFPPAGTNEYLDNTMAQNGINIMSTSREARHPIISEYCNLSADSQQSADEPESAMLPPKFTFQPVKCQPQPLVYGTQNTNNKKAKNINSRGDSTTTKPFNDETTKRLHVYSSNDNNTDKSYRDAEVIGGETEIKQIPIASIINQENKVITCESTTKNESSSSNPTEKKLNHQQLERPQATSAPTKKRTWVDSRCDICFKAKTRCSRNKPTCYTCKFIGLECGYSKPQVSSNSNVSREPAESDADNLKNARIKHLIKIVESTVKLTGCPAL